MAIGPFRTISILQTHGPRPLGLQTCLALFNCVLAVERITITGHTPKRPKFVPLAGSARVENRRRLVGRLLFLSAKFCQGYFFSRRWKEERKPKRQERESKEQQWKNTRQLHRKSASPNTIPFDSVFRASNRKSLDLIPLNLPFTLYSRSLSL